MQSRGVPVMSVGAAVCGVCFCPAWHGRYGLSGSAVVPVPRLVRLGPTFGGLRLPASIEGFVGGVFVRGMSSLKRGHNLIPLARTYKLGSAFLILLTRLLACIYLFNHIVLRCLCRGRVYLADLIGPGGGFTPGVGCSL